MSEIYKKDVLVQKLKLLGLDDINVGILEIMPFEFVYADNKDVDIFDYICNNRINFLAEQLSKWIQDRSVIEGIRVSGVEKELLYNSKLDNHSLLECCATDIWRIVLTDCDIARLAKSCVMHPIQLDIIYSTYNLVNKFINTLRYVYELKNLKRVPQLYGYELDIEYKDRIFIINRVGSTFNRDNVRRLVINGKNLSKDENICIVNVTEYYTSNKIVIKYSVKGSNITNGIEFEI